MAEIAAASAQFQADCYYRDANLANERDLARPKKNEMLLQYTRNCRVGTVVMGSGNGNGPL